MVKKESRQKVRVKKHNRVRNRFSGTAERPRLSVLEATIICMLRLLTIQLEIL